MKVFIALSELALVLKKAALYQDPCYGSTPEAAVRQALEEVLEDPEQWDWGDNIVIIVD